MGKKINAAAAIAIIAFGATQADELKSWVGIGDDDTTTESAAKKAQENSGEEIIPTTTSSTTTTVPVIGMNGDQGTTTTTTTFGQYIAPRNIVLMVDDVNHTTSFVDQTGETVCNFEGGEEILLSSNVPDSGIISVNGKDSFDPDVSIYQRLTLTPTPYNIPAYATQIAVQGMNPAQMNAIANGIAPSEAGTATIPLTQGGIIPKTLDGGAFKGTGLINLATACNTPFEDPSKQLPDTLGR